MTTRSKESRLRISIFRTFYQVEPCDTVIPSHMVQCNTISGTELKLGLCPLATRTPWKAAQTDHTP